MTDDIVLVSRRFMPMQPGDSPFILPSETLSVEGPHQPKPATLESSNSQQKHETERSIPQQIPDR